MPVCGVKSVIANCGTCLFTRINTQAVTCTLDKITEAENDNSIISTHVHVHINGCGGYLN